MDTFSNTFLFAYAILVLLVVALAWLVYDAIGCWKKIDAEERMGYILLIAVVTISGWYTLTHHLLII